MAPRKEEDFEKIRVESRKKILETATELLAEKGYGGTTMSELAKRAGVSKGLAYNYFGSKEEILAEVVRSGLQELFDSFELPEGALSDDDVAKMIEHNFDILDNDPKRWSLYFMVFLQPEASKIAGPLIFEIMAPILEKLAVFLSSKGVEKPLVEAYFVGSVLDGISLNYLYNKEIYPKEYAIKRLKQILKLE